MMKIKILPLLGILLTGVRGPQLQTMFLSMVVGPFDKNQNDPSVSYTIESTFNVSKTIYEIFRFGDNSNPNMQTVTKANHTIASGATYTGYVTFPTKSLLGSSGMKVTVDIYNSNGSRIRTMNCYIYPRVRQTVDPTKYDSHTCPQTRAVFNLSMVSYTNETYTFTKVDDYFLTDVYYRLPIEQFELETSLSSSEFTYTSAYLKVPGMNTYFPGLTYSNSTAVIPLSVNYNDGKLTLSVKDNLYVHAKLLIMSQTSKQGYVATKNFYLPVNHSKDLVGSSFILGMEGVGYNKTSFIWICSLLAENPLVGNCQNSGYCVVGTVTK